MHTARRLHAYAHTCIHTHTHSLTHTLTHTHILAYSQLRYVGETQNVPVGNPHPSGSVTTTLSGLKGDTEYTVTVSAVNGAGEGESMEITVTTQLGVFPPVISVVLTEEANSVYILRINGFSTDYGALRYMYIYGVGIT